MADKVENYIKEARDKLKFDRAKKQYDADKIESEETDRRMQAKSNEAKQIGYQKAKKRGREQIKQRELNAGRYGDYDSIMTSMVPLLVALAEGDPLGIKTKIDGIVDWLNDARKKLGIRPIDGICGFLKCLGRGIMGRGFKLQEAHDLSEIKKQIENEVLPSYGLDENAPLFDNPEEPVTKDMIKSAMENAYSSNPEDDNDEEIAKATAKPLFDAHEQWIEGLGYSIHDDSGEYRKNGEILKKDEHLIRMCDPAHGFTKYMSEQGVTFEMPQSAKDRVPGLLEALQRERQAAAPRPPGL